VFKIVKVNYTWTEGWGVEFNKICAIRDVRHSVSAPLALREAKDFVEAVFGVLMRCAKLSIVTGFTVQKAGVYFYPKV
jgi:hypothetical protein